jgi:mRNA-degrading endonuclease RelE of RelBE toxin-antitoxin system
VIEAIVIHLRHETLKQRKSRIKRLRGMQRPGYRLRIGEIRVFYDVSQDTVEILAVVSKSKAGEWLERVGESK